MYFSLSSIYSCRNSSLFSSFSISRYSWVSNPPSSTCNRHTAMLEQWSAARSKFVEMSERTNPSSMVHVPVLRRLICLCFSSLFSASTTCSNGSTSLARPVSPVSKASTALSIMSRIALENTRSSCFALSENCRFFCSFPQRHHECLPHDGNTLKVTDTMKKYR